MPANVFRCGSPTSEHFLSKTTHVVLVYNTSRSNDFRTSEHLNAVIVLNVNKELTNCMNIIEDQINDFVSRCGIFAKTHLVLFD